MSDWQELVLGPLIGGIDSRFPPSNIKDGASPSVWNMVFSGGRVETDYGLGTYGETVIGRPRLVFKFRRKNGVTDILLVTNARVYKWAAGEWQYVKGPQSTTVSGDHSAGATSITVASITGFADGDPVGITMDNSKQHRTTISGTPTGNTIVIADPIPTGRSVPDGSMFLETEVLTGDDGHPVTADTFPAGDVMVFTNGNDNVKYYDGTSVQDVPNLVAAVGGSNCYADVVLVKDNKVILFNTNENGADYPQRVRWSATGDYTDWTTSGDAGYEDLYDVEDPIIAAARAGSNIAVYRDKSLYLMEYIGSASLIYRFSRVFDSDGICSAHAVIENRQINIFMGKNGFYAYAGGVEVTEFGDEVWEKIFGSGELFSVAYADKVHGFFDERTKRYLFWFPAYDRNAPTLTAVYDLKTKSWTIREFGRSIFHIADARVVSGLSWAEASGNWEDTSWTSKAWNDISLQTGDSVVLAAAEDGSGTGQVYEYSEEYSDDDGEGITGEFQTKELFLPRDYIRINRLIVKAKGSSITISYSIDEGSSWVSYGTVSPGSEYDEVSVWGQIVARRVMFKFSGTNFGLDRITVEWKPESRY